MKKIITMILVAGLTVSLIACSKEDTDGEPLDIEQTESAEEEAEAFEPEDTVEDSAYEAEPEEVVIPEISLENPSDEIRNMISLMDALNIASVSLPSAYDPKNPEYVWYTIHIALCNTNFRGVSFDNDGTYLCVPEAFVRDTYFAMFYDSDEMPDIPDEMLEGEYPSIKIEDDNYYFMLGDRGISDYKAYDSLVYDSGEIIISVRLYSEEFIPDEEIYSGNYWMYPNLEPDSFYAYNIYDGGPANEYSDKKLKGGVSIGYLSYDDGSYYEPDEAKANMRLDIPMFECLDFDNTAVTDLNKRIYDELYSMTNDLYTEENYDITWLEIYTERYDSDEYVQAVTTAIEYPNYATEGDIYSYNYDVVNRKAMTNQDGLDLTGITEQEMYKNIKDKYKPEYDYDEYDHSEYKGFCVLDDGTVDYYFVIYIKNEASSDRNALMVYHSKDGTIGKYNS